jgi:hypothetical protein
MQLLLDEEYSPARALERAMRIIPLADVVYYVYLYAVRYSPKNLYKV